MNRTILNRLLAISLCLAAITLHSCNKDDSTEIVPATKHATHITMTRHGEAAPYRTYDIRYNSDGTFAEMSYYSKEDDDTVAYNFAKEGEQLIIGRAGFERKEVYLLNEEGYIVTADIWSALRTKFSRVSNLEFGYNDGLLRTLTDNGEIYISCTWVRQNMTTFYNDYSGSVYYNYSDAENKMDIDPANLFCDISNDCDPDEPSSLLLSSGFLGRKSKHLPSKLLIKGSTDRYLITLTYEYDTEGYPVSISALRKWNDPDNDDAEVSEVTTIGISYTK